MTFLLLGGCVHFHSAPPPNAPQNATFIHVDGVQIRVQEQGTGPAVLLLHGYSSSSDIWQEIMPMLARHHRVIAIDLKGFGWSGRPKGDYSPTAQARLAWRVLDKLQVTDAAIVGHSWGASVAMAMALAQQKRVRRIALYSAYVYEQQVPSFFLWARMPYVGESLFAMYYQERIADRVA